MLVKKSFTFVELLIGFFILAAVAGTLSFGFFHYYRHAALKNSQERIERLLSQADFLSTVLQQEAKIFILQQQYKCKAVLQPWGENECEALDLFKNLPCHFIELEGVNTLQFNDSNVSELSLIFLPMKGIDTAYIQAKDSNGYPLSLKELRLEPPARTNTTTTLILYGKERDKITGNLVPFPVDLSTFTRMTTHLSIPQEYIDLDM